MHGARKTSTLNNEYIQRMPRGILFLRGNLLTSKYIFDTIQLYRSGKPMISRHNLPILICNGIKTETFSVVSDRSLVFPWIKFGNVEEIGHGIFVF